MTAHYFQYNLERIYHTLAVWYFKPILGSGLQIHYFIGGLQLRNYCVVEGNHTFSLYFWFLHDLVEFILIELRSLKERLQNLLFYVLL